MQLTKKETKMWGKGPVDVYFGLDLYFIDYSNIVLSCKNEQQIIHNTAFQGH